MLEINNTTDFIINKKDLKNIAEEFFRKNRIKGKNVSLAFISDKEMKNLNSVYRRQNKTTDVLSFSGEDDCLGEILISPSQIKRQAKEAKISFKQELLFVFVHGLLHLIGYDDSTEEKRLKMIDLGNDFLEKIKL